MTFMGVSMGLDSRQRQRRFKKNRRKAGCKRLQVWVSRDAYESLKRLICYTYVNHIQATQSNQIMALIEARENQIINDILETHGKDSMNLRAYLSANQMMSQDVIENGFRIYR